MRRGLCTGLRDEAFLHGQLRAGGVSHAAVPLVDAAPVGAQQAARNLHRFRRLQADHWLELRTQRAVGQVLEHGRGRGRRHAVAVATQIHEYVGVSRTVEVLRQRAQPLAEPNQPWTAST